MVYWLQEDERFKTGTVCDTTSFRMALSKKKGGNWHLLIQVRKHQHDGVEPGLSAKILVADFGKCSLEEAQEKAEQWYEVFTEKE